MILLIHVSSAILGLISASLLLAKPSQILIKLSGVCCAVTLLSGTMLVLTRHAALAQTCVSGLIYLAVMLGAICFGRLRLETTA